MGRTSSTTVPYPFNATDPVFLLIFFSPFLSLFLSFLLFSSLPIVTVSFWILREHQTISTKRCCSKNWIFTEPALKLPGVWRSAATCTQWNTTERPIWWTMFLGCGMTLLFPYISTCLLAYLPACLLPVSQSVCLSCLFVLSVCLHIRLSVHVPLCQSIDLSSTQSVSQSVSVWVLQTTSTGHELSQKETSRCSFTY